VTAAERSSIERAYEAGSWIDSRVAIGLSRLHGRGMFARARIAAGEVVVVWGGTLFTEDDVRAGRARRGSVSAVDEGVYLAGRAEDGADEADFMNHSCEPNVWMLDEVTLAARRDVAPGEELTADYAMWEGDEAWVSRWACRCGAASCRGRVTGRDWRLPELQERYRGGFSPFIERRIARLAGGGRGHG
jgi:hypothetical protein